jgi:hypothetical protein
MDVDTPEVQLSVSEETFVTDVRSRTHFPDSDDMLTAVGQVLCDGLRTYGHHQTSQDFRESTYTAQQQEVLLTSAAEHLC